MNLRTSLRIRHEQICDYNFFLHKTSRDVKHAMQCHQQHPVPFASHWPALDNLWATILLQRPAPLPQHSCCCCMADSGFQLLAAEGLRNVQQAVLQLHTRKADLLWAHLFQNLITCSSPGASQMATGPPNEKYCIEGLGCGYLRAHLFQDLNMHQTRVVSKEAMGGTLTAAFS